MNKNTFLIAIWVLISSTVLAQKTPIKALSNYRPVYHYTPSKNWVNDPNGLVYLDGEYHLFYQYNPLGDKWGHMSWGHAISKDLQNWKTLPTALPEFTNPDKSTTMIFSGCVVIDSSNTTGFFEKGLKKGMIAVFTSHIEGKVQHQSLAYSSNKGRTWKYYDKNPVLDIGLKDFRDPNVIWYPERQVWIMSVVKALEYTIQFYESKDLKKWLLLSEFGKVGDLSKIWECPSLTKVPVENSDKFKWVLMVSCGHQQNNYLAMQYFVGEFDGTNFVSQKQNEPLYVDEGKDFYAAIPFKNLPQSQKNPVIMGWLNDWDYARDIPTTGFRGGFSIPRAMSLKFEEGNYRLFQKPILDNKAFKNVYLKSNFTINEPFPLALHGSSYQLITEMDVSNTDGFTIEILKKDNEKSIVSYDKKSNILSFDRTKSGNVSFHSKFPSVERMVVKPINNHIKLQILVDNSVVEIFANDGQKCLTDLVFPNNNSDKINISPKNGQLKIDRLSIFRR